MKSLKSQGLPVNIVVMLIIGIIIFAIGMSLFSRIYTSSEEEVEKLNALVRSDIATLECSGDEWICTPSYKMKNGESKTFEVFVANRGETNAKFSISFESLDEVDAGKYGITNDCGSVLVVYPPNIEANIRSGFSGSFPFTIKATRVKNTPCSFVTTVDLVEDGILSGKKTPVIIRVE